VACDAHGCFPEGSAPTAGAHGSTRRGGDDPGHRTGPVERGNLRLVVVTRGSGSATREPPVHDP
jgi:hypothetical protein